jgi:hypothetical protein
VAILRHDRRRIIGKEADQPRPVQVEIVGQRPQPFARRFSSDDGAGASVARDIDNKAETLQYSSIFLVVATRLRYRVARVNRAQ